MNYKTDFLKKNPVFWSRLGFCYDPPMYNDQGKPLVFTENLDKYALYHRDFTKNGVKIHTSILHSGWVGINKYDYSLTDRVLDAVFKDNPDIYYIPRIKLNVPIDWTTENPEELFVYYEGPRDAEEIRALTGTERHDYLGYEAPNGYYQAGDYVDTRKNVGGLISMQSFSSKKWLQDAVKALEKLIERLENGKYGNRILGYHVAYGTSGETVLWGRISERYGDYGIRNRREFFKWGLNKYGSIEDLKEAWNQPNLTEDNLIIPSPEERYRQTSSLVDFFRGKKEDRICTDFDEFISEINADDVEFLCRTVKKCAPDKLAGVFYGYFMHIDDSAYTGHLAIEKLLESPYIDFFAAPKSYYRCGDGEPGGVLCPTKSINLKKLWVDELDNRTYLAQNVEVADWKSKGLENTKTIFWRELCKNLSDDSGFWWMDLGGGWFDDDKLLNTVGEMVKFNDVIRKRKHKSTSDVLIVVDENCITKMNISKELRLGFMEDFICEVHMSGVLADVYRLSDLSSLDLSQYKLIVFAYTFEINSDMAEVIHKSISPDTTVMWNYTAGIWKDGECSLKNVESLTGFRLEECENEDYGFPGVKVITDNGFADICVKGKKIINVKPFMRAETIAEIAKNAGCHMYTSPGICVYGDNRFIGVFTKNDYCGTLNLPQKSNCRNVENGEIHENSDVIHVDMKAEDRRVFILE